LLDIASGPGRYVLETMHALPAIPISAVLRDYKQENLDAAARLRDELGLDQVALQLGDAFDRAALAAVTPRPTIALVSGLYELFPSNEPVLRSLRGLAEAVEPGGHLIYTNQPWHPQVEFIARTLTNREGRPWIMRRRTQAEMDELVRTAGFEKVSQEIDPWGIFTVSTARRAGA
jgi:SAM-dependent methyltransferase